ncbi:major facilitator superfamily domain-containing protein [Aspergillus avenaceus]|uniref:Major facilitator superfamily domain-containing protein n=1 Tax=Aspergillus avenaceus TaxID=36643 RepID=A0A5N6TXS7_ASPAV|nr:major facilitator superfamily domain-containing protein [Aspergillus avenaceus]
MVIEKGKESHGGSEPISTSNSNCPSDLEKHESEFIGEAKEDHSQLDEACSALSPSHRDYLLKRHGTIDLDPLPSLSGADPYNWPMWKKLTNPILVAFHACMATFTASIIPAYEDIAIDLNVSLQRASYLTSLQIAVLGGAPLFWKPLSNRYGRRPIFLLSTILSLVCNVGCAKSPTYASMAACRALTAFFISPAAAIGSAVVAETFFKKERGRYMGIWTLMVTLGVPIGPLIFGFVANRAGYRWIFWLLAITNGVQFVLYIFFGPETRYVGRAEDSPSDFKSQYLSFRRIDPTPLTFGEFIHPLTMAKYPSVMIPAVVYAMVFLFGSVLITVEVPQLLQEKFDLNAEQLGLQFLGVIIGTILGEQIGGSMSDYWMNSRARHTRKRPEPEYRLWLSYPGIVLAIVGVIVFLICTQQADENWVVSPIVGTAVAAFGNQLVTTVMVTYAVDCFPQDAGSVGVFITFVRQVWGFIGPFWFPDMFKNVGVAASSGITSALMFVFSLLPTIVLHIAGRRWRIST